MKTKSTTSKDKDNDRDQRRMRQRQRQSFVANQYFHSISFTSVRISQHFMCSTWYKECNSLLWIHLNSKLFELMGCYSDVKWVGAIMVDF